MQGRHSLGSRRLGRIGCEIHFLWFRDRSENCVVSYVASERRGIPGPKIGTSTPQTKTCRYHPKKQRPLLGAPGVFRTDLNAQLLDGTPRGQELLMRTPMGRFGRTEELVGAVVYLASDSASFVTGQILVVDGGFLASGVNQ